MCAVAEGGLVQALLLADISILVEGEERRGNEKDRVVCWFVGLLVLVNYTSAAAPPPSFPFTRSEAGGGGQRRGGVGDCPATAQGRGIKQPNRPRRTPSEGGVGGGVRGEV